MQFNEWLAANGFDPAALTETQKIKLQAAWRAEQGPEPNAGNPTTKNGKAASPDPEPNRATLPVARRADEDPFEAQMAAIRAETGRRDEIKGLVIRACEQWKGNIGKIDQIQAIGEAAIEAGTDVKDFKINLLHLSRPDAPNVFAREDKVPDDAVMEAAFCVGAGLQSPEKFFPEQTLDAARKRFRNGLSIGELLQSYAARNGYARATVRQDLRGVLRAAFYEGDIKAAGSWGPSTGGGLSGVLSNTANKFLRVAFESVDPAWRQFVDIRSLNDFKAVTYYSLTGDMQYEEVPPGGEIKHAQLGSESSTLQLNTYGRMLGLDRRDIINDDLGAFTNVTRKLGRGGALKINDLVYTKFLNNTSFFTAGRNNLVTSNALSLAGLDAAYQKFLNQTDPDGKPLAVTPRILLVPPGLAATARTLMSSTGLVSGATTAPGTPSNNIWAGMFEVVTSPYLANASYTGSSATSWYLLASPMDVPVVAVGFLNGNESPTIETAEADFSQLGISYRGFHDIAAGLDEYRGGVRNNA